MNNKNELILALILITIFTTTLIHMPTIKNNDNSRIGQKQSYNQPNHDPIEEPTDLEYLKTSSSLTHESDFSFNTSIYETYNRSWTFINVQPSNPWMIADNTKGVNVTLELNITDLRDSFNQLILPSSVSLNLTRIYTNLLHPFYPTENVGPIQDIVAGQGYFTGIVKMNDTFDGFFRLNATDSGITYDAYMVFKRESKESVVKTMFIPDIENTKSDSIIWELKYDNYLPRYFNGYRAVLKIDNLSDFTLREVKGNNYGYWDPIDYYKNETHIIIDQSYEEYIIELQMPNFVSIIYNDNLTVSNNRLNLYTTCNMAGNLTIEFTDVYNKVYTANYSVLKDDEIFFDYPMLSNSSGGKGFLNVTLTNNSKIIFGIKYAEISFFKDAIIFGVGQNTTSAFSEFYVMIPYIDFSLFQEIIIRNITETLNLTIYEALNYSLIRGAKVTYEIAGFTGEVEETIVPINVSEGIYNNSKYYNKLYNLSIYFSVIDMRELLIEPGIYNVTFTASKEGYTYLETVFELEITKKHVNILIDVTPSDNIFTIDESFSLTISFYVLIGIDPFYELFLRHPVYANLTFTNLDTGEIELEFQWYGIDGLPYPILQEFTIADYMGNTTLPGNYNLNITLDSEYYEGSKSINITVRKKQLDLSLDYDNEVDEDENFDIQWSLASGNFTGNRENMTLEIYLDGRLLSTVNLTATNASSGVITLKLDEGDYTVTYRLVSPFYEAERIIAIESVGGKSKKEELSWLEENWIFLLLLILAVIAMSIFGVYMTISRRRVKAQRELDSELVALKTRIAATEENISLIQKQISEIAGIYWILVIHSEQGTTMVEITEFRFNEVLGEEFKVFVEEGMIRDSALIGGFLTAIRNFSRETAGESHEYQPIFNSQTDYSTIVNDKEVHRRILEGAGYFMAFISARGTMEISEVLSTVNSKFHEGYGHAAKEFLGKITVFNPFKEEVVSYLHDEIRELQKRLEDEIILRQNYENNLKRVQDKIGIKKNK